ncbi:MAG TPA: hypothetical protein DCL73_04210 [Treponema sp.]|nr:hypothetical protein [Treponema sp.]
MKTAEWFACLSFGKYDILFPREAVLECRYGADAAAEIKWNDAFIRPLNFDGILEKKFGFTISGSLNCTLILNGTYDYAVQTEAVPSMTEIALSEFRPVSGLAGGFLLSSGIIAFRFQHDRIQYVVDVQKLAEKSGADA